MRELPNAIFRGDERYWAHVDMCHFGLVGSRVPDPTNFRSTKLAAATTRAPLLPVIAQLKDYCNLHAPPWSTWCSIQSEAMGLHAHLKNGAPTGLIACVGSFTGGAFGVEAGGLLNASIKDKKRHTRVHKGFQFQRTAEALGLFNTCALHAPLPWQGQRWSVIFYYAGGMPHCDQTQFVGATYEQGVLRLEAEKASNIDEFV